MAELQPGESPVCVTVVYALPRQAFEYAVGLGSGATVQDAIAASGIRGAVPDLDLSSGVGIFGRPCGLSERLESGDRVEIYRELAIDPREARRLRALNERI